MAMRYIVIDSEPETTASPTQNTPRHAANLRRELSARNIEWAQANDFLHEISLGSTPAILYREDASGKHGNFHPSAYRRIRSDSAWNERLKKVHTSARKILLSRDTGRCELDSCNSSDALLMSIFCHPQVLRVGSQLPALLGVDHAVHADFGYCPRIPFKNGRFDRTEIDMRLNSLLFEAKLTEHDFQTAPLRLAERYRDFEEVFDIESLPRSKDLLLSYQLVRGALAAFADAETRFCVICDARRPDLISDWYRIQQCVRLPMLRCRLMLVTWQEISAASPRSLQQWLSKKYGIDSV